MLRALAISIAISTIARAQSHAPPMTPLRYDEDYSYLERAAERGASWEQFKEVALDDDGIWRASIGIELRAKHERYENDGWSADPDADHDYTWWRALPYVDVHSDDVRVFGQLIAAVEVGDEAGTSPVDENRADVLQAFVDVDVARDSWTLRAGRQVLALGSERLISARNGPNVLRSFDAAGFVARKGAWTVDALWGRPVKVELGEFDDEADDARALWTLYATCELAPSRGYDL